MIQNTRVSYPGGVGMPAARYVRWCLLPLGAALLLQSAYAQVAPPDQELLRQQERERALREQLERPRTPAYRRRQASRPPCCRGKKPPVSRFSASGWKATAPRAFSGP